MAIRENNKRKRQLNRELKKKNTCVIAKSRKSEWTSRFVTRFAQETAHSDNVVWTKFQRDNLAQWMLIGIIIKILQVTSIQIENRVYIKIKENKANIDQLRSRNWCRNCLSTIISYIYSC